MSLPHYKQHTFVVIPAYNEEETLHYVINDLNLHGYYNIIVVDDGSINKLVSEIKDMSIYYLRHKMNLGQGAALQTGFDFAKKMNAEYVITFDADGQHLPQDLDAMLQELIAANLDVILGSRFLMKNTTLPLVKRWLLQAARLINYMFTGILLTDAHNGLRVLNKKALHLINITENGMSHASEILFEIKNNNLQYKEMPVVIQYTNYSKIKGQKAGNSVKILSDLILYKIFK
jgi:glycosyltransferase involved in cell wall biosynthesis